MATDTSRADRRIAVLLLLMFAASLPGVTLRIYASDEVQYFAYLRSLWFDRDLSFDNEYRHFYEAGVARSPGFHETFLERTTPTGRRENFGTLGCALVWAPLYAVAHLAARLLNMLGSPVPVDGFSWPYIAAVCYTSATCGWLALIMGLMAARRLLPEPAAGTWGAKEAIPAVLVWLGTPLLFYMYIAPPMSHAVSACTVAAFVLAWLRVRERWTAGGMAALGALGGLMAMVREQDAFFAVPVAVDFVWSALQRLRAGRSSPAPDGRVAAMLGPALTGALAFGVVYAPQLIAYQIINGRPGPSTLVSRKMNWLSPHALQVLLSPEHGFLFWTPIAAIALAGLVVIAARSQSDRQGARRVAACLLGMVALQVYVAGSVESWTVAGAFGQRRFVALTALLVVGLAAVVRHVGTRAARFALAAGLAACVWWNVGLAVQFGSGLMDRQRLELGRNAYANFVSLPRMLPELAYRYVFDRASFYQGRSDGVREPERR